MTAKILYFRRSDALRKKAADELRAARKSTLPHMRMLHLRIALSYKALAEAEAWLAGERSRIAIAPAGSAAPIFRSTG